MSKLLFRCAQASDGRIFALLTDQLNVEEDFDAAYKLAYQDLASSNTKILAKWKDVFSVQSAEFTQLSGISEIPAQIKQAFNQLAHSVLKGIDVFFCDYNLGIEGDLPMADEMMDKFGSTDFILFSGEALVGQDPKTQPYLVSYTQPRYSKGRQIAQQHRIYCKTSHFPFYQAIIAIVTQRQKDTLNGGPIRSDVTPYIGEAPADAKIAEQALNCFCQALVNDNKPSGQSASAIAANPTDSLDATGMV